MARNELPGDELQRRVRLGKEAVARAASLRPEARPKALDPSRDVFDGVAGLPEISVRDLTAHSVASGILHHGGLVVRELFDAEQVGALREHLPSDESVARVCITPAAVIHLLSVYRHVGAILSEYLGEPPVSALQRTRIKRDTQASGLRWHQDAPLFGGERRAVNFWTALTPVGDRCPGLSVLPSRVPWTVAPGYDLADLEDQRGDEAVRELGQATPPVSPVLAAGDAVVFDEMTLHRTQATTWKVACREVAITWFFAPSRFPSTLGLRKPIPCTPVWLAA